MNEETLPGGEVIDFMRGQLAEKLLQKSGLDTEILLLQESLNYIYANSREYELRDVLGQPVESALAAIINKLAPSGADSDEAAARKAVELSILSIFEEYGVEADGINRLDAMDAAAVEKAFQTLVSEYNFQRWMLELGKRVEEGTVSASEAVRLEAIAKECIIEATQLDLRGYNVLATDWSTAESQTIINDIFAQAYVFLEDL